MCKWIHMHIRCITRDLRVGLLQWIIQNSNRIIVSSFFVSLIALLKYWEEWFSKCIASLGQNSYMWWAYTSRPGYTGWFGSRQLSPLYISEDQEQNWCTGSDRDYYYLFNKKGKDCPTWDSNWHTRLAKLGWNWDKPTNHLLLITKVKLKIFETQWLSIKDPYLECIIPIYACTWWSFLW